jgi:hypothetical protein
MANVLWDSNLGSTTTIDGMAIGKTTPATGAFTLLGVSVATGLTASTTQTLAGGLALSKAVNNVSTVANVSDAVTLPALLPGQSAVVLNSGANPMKVFPNAASVQIDGGTAGAAVTLTNAKRCAYYCLATNVIVSAQLGAASA